MRVISVTMKIQTMTADNLAQGNHAAEQKGPKTQSQLTGAMVDLYLKVNGCLSERWKTQHQ